MVRTLAQVYISSASVLIWVCVLLLAALGVERHSGDLSEHVFNRRVFLRTAPEMFDVYTLCMKKKQMVLLC